MEISWSSGDYSYQAEITKCGLADDRINIVFKGRDGSDFFHGRFILEVSNDEQTQEGFWIYPESRQEKARFSETQLESEGLIVKATVTGKLQNFRGKKVVFVGKWDETVSDPEDGEVWDLELEAQIDE